MLQRNNQLYNGFIWKYFNSEKFQFEIDGIKENKIILEKKVYQQNSKVK